MRGPPTIVKSRKPMDPLGMFPRAAATARAGRPRILIVDDDDAIRAVVRAALDDQGYEIAEAIDGLEALGICKKRCPDVILLELNMPRLDGRSFLERHRREHRCVAHVLLLSTVTDAQRVALDLEADAFVAKPFSIGELADAVRAHATLATGPLRA